MENVNTKEGFFFRIKGSKTFAVPENDDGTVFCPFCYGQVQVEIEKCPCCGKTIPELIYYHGDDDTWIASGCDN